MVQVLCRLVAVLAATAVASEHRTAVDGDHGCAWHAHVSSEAHDRWLGNLHALGSKDLIGGVDHFGLVSQNEQEGTPRRHDAERLKRGIEHQSATCRPFAPLPHRLPHLSVRISL
jgi:hypothetical protein